MCGVMAELLEPLFLFEDVVWVVLLTNRYRARHNSRVEFECCRIEICTGIKESRFEGLKLGGDRSQLDPNEDGLARERAIASRQRQE